MATRSVVDLLGVLLVLGWYSLNAVAHAHVVFVWPLAPNAVWLAAVQCAICAPLLPLVVVEQAALLKFVRNADMQLSGALFAVGTAATTFSLGSGSFLFTQMVKASEPVFSVALTKLWYPERHVSRLRLLATAMIVASVSIALAGKGVKPRGKSGAEQSDSVRLVLALSAAIISNIALQSRNIVNKKVIQMHDELFAQAPPSSRKTLMAQSVFAVSGTLACAFLVVAGVLLGTFHEVHNIPRLFLTYSARSTWVMLLAFAVYQLCSIFILQRVSPVTHAVLNALKRCFMILVSFALDYRIPQRAEVLGLVCLGFSLLFYGHVESAERAASAEEQSMPPPSVSDTDEKASRPWVVPMLWVFSWSSLIFLTLASEYNTFSSPRRVWESTGAVRGGSSASSRTRGFALAELTPVPIFRGADQETRAAADLDPRLPTSITSHRVSALDIQLFIDAVRAPSVAFYCFPGAAVLCNAYRLSGRQTGDVHGPVEYIDMQFNQVCDGQGDHELPGLEFFRKQILWKIRLGGRFESYATLLALLCLAGRESPSVVLSDHVVVAIRETNASARISEMDLWAGQKEAWPEAGVFVYMEGDMVMGIRVSREAQARVAAETVLGWASEGSRLTMNHIAELGKIVSLDLGLQSPLATGATHGRPFSISDVLFGVVLPVHGIQQLQAAASSEHAKDLKHALHVFAMVRVLPRLDFFSDLCFGSFVFPSGRLDMHKLVSKSRQDVEPARLAGVWTYEALGSGCPQGNGSAGFQAYPFNDFVPLSLNYSTTMHDQHAWLRAHGPVGAQDRISEQQFRAEGIPAHVFGRSVAMTLLPPDSDVLPKRETILFALADSALLDAGMSGKTFVRDKLTAEMLPQATETLIGHDDAWMHSYTQFVALSRAAVLVTDTLELAFTAAASATTVLLVVPERLIHQDEAIRLFHVVERESFQEVGNLEQAIRNYTRDWDVARLPPNPDPERFQSSTLHLFMRLESHPDLSRSRWLTL
ncbi:Phosphoenolpyruvate/phosphate translocator 1, chloroplastic [Porphyridium purpureum]|uniref:Phosphoenolpyruvate/phosphate translocator 1, chloroplastic n=1 Tax=Porphyridium purpureum TaxID=35688 RepID=A0A5J4YNE0_PORPP|nr:Phosphoenolpyruvate/phosphate translocator 1, chloroplastic [Porphyridium purpureum]|eukprot:POR8889..scf295_9